jgi:hypothetical protein
MVLGLELSLAFAIQTFSSHHLLTIAPTRKKPINANDNKKNIVNNFLLLRFSITAPDIFAICVWIYCKKYFRFNLLKGQSNKMVCCSVISMSSK